MIYLWAFLWKTCVLLATNFKHASIILFILFRWLIKFFFMSQIICPRVFCSVFKNGIMQIQLSHLQNGIIILRKKERKMNFEKPATRATVLYKWKKIIQKRLHDYTKGQNQRILWKKFITLLAPTGILIGKHWCSSVR